MLGSRMILTKSLDDGPFDATVDCRTCGSWAEVVSAFKEQLSLPDYTGLNPTALWESLLEESPRPELRLALLYPESVEGPESPGMTVLLRCLQDVVEQAGSEEQGLRACDIVVVTDTVDS